MKKFASAFAVAIATNTLAAVKMTTTCTIGAIGFTSTVANSLAVAGCNTGIRKLRGKDTSFAKELRRVNDINDSLNKIADGRYSLSEFVDSAMPEDFRVVMDEIKRTVYNAKGDVPNTSPEDAFDINGAKTTPAV